MLHIYAPKPVDRRCVVIDCPTCERPRRMHAAYYEWHGADLICAGCGDEWHDGEMADRPFAPGWRRKNIERARELLAKLGVQA